MVKWTSDEIEWCTCNKLKEAEERAAKWDAIVRCWECKYWNETYDECRLVNGKFLNCDGDGFCAWGERRDA